MATAFQAHTGARMPAFRVNDLVPRFEAPSTHGEIRLRDLRGDWLLLFVLSSAEPWPHAELVSDFVAEARAFRRARTRLVGVILASSHPASAWRQAIERDLGRPLTFPIIVDDDGSIATRWRLEREGHTGSVQSAYVVDPSGCVRADLHFSRARIDVAELRLVVESLRRADASAEARRGALGPNRLQATS